MMQQRAHICRQTCARVTPWRFALAALGALLAIGNAAAEPILILPAARVDLPSEFNKNVAPPRLVRGSEPYLLPEQLPESFLEVAQTPRSTAIAASGDKPGPITIDGHPVDNGAFEKMLQQQFDPEGKRIGCESCEQPGRCYPGQNRCEEFPKTGLLSRFIGGIYECICCPDPCYEPRWIGLADSAFFTEGARPVSQMRIRFDSAHNINWPDRGEYIWARSDGKGKGLKPIAPYRGEREIKYNELSVYTEAARGAFSATVLTPYRAIDPVLNPDHSGFADMVIGTKSLIVDCELFLLAFQFNTYLPVGGTRTGIGVGHVSLEPGLIGGLRVSPKSFLQFQLAEWIPLGGDANYAGAALKYSFAYNHMLCQPVKDLQLIGSLEFNGIGFQDGAFTDKVRGPFQQASGTTDNYIGGGLRLIFCDKVDLGFGASFAVSERRFWREFYRTEFRVRY